MNPSSQVVDERTPIISHAEPVLVVDNVIDTVEYWKTVLGFTHGWTYGNPVNHGGVSWNSASFIQFGKNSGDGVSPKGHSVWLRARNIAALYELHQRNRAEIISPLETKPWGHTEYGVRELNGYVVYFSAPVLEHSIHSSGLPSTIKIQTRKPTPGEHHEVVAAVGWVSSDDPSEGSKVIDGCVMGAVAENTDTGEIVGSVLLLGDQVGFYYIKDLVVKPEWQKKQIGRKLMKSLMDWLNVHAPEGATVGLFTGDHLANFYRQFGFMQCCGMYTQILRKNEALPSIA